MFDVAARIRASLVGVGIDDLVVVERREDGSAKLHQPSLTGLGAASGALWGGLIGLIFFAQGWCQPSRGA